MIAFQAAAEANPACQPVVAVQSILDLRIMSKDCKKEARDFDNPAHELAYTVATVSITSLLLCC